MAILKKGNFELNFGFLKVSAEVSEEDRQCAWALYTEMSTRVSVIGKSRDSECKNFEGELLVESLNSLYAFFQEARRIMRDFPVGRLEQGKKEHLGVMISQVMENVLRPFLEKWHMDFRYWWEHQSNPRLLPKDRQSEYPKLTEFLDDWASVRYLMRELQKELIAVYRLVDVGAQESASCISGSPI